MGQTLGVQHGCFVAPKTYNVYSIYILVEYVERKKMHAWWKDFNEKIKYNRGNIFIFLYDKEYCIIINLYFNILLYYLRAREFLIERIYMGIFIY